MFGQLLRRWFSPVQVYLGLTPPSGIPIQCWAFGPQTGHGHLGIMLLAKPQKVNTLSNQVLAT